MMKLHKLTRRSLLLVLVALILSGMGISASWVFGADAGSKTLTVLSTNDRHSNYLSHPYDPANPTALDSKSIGGVARLATVIDKVRASQKDVLLLDAGDFCDETAFICAEKGSVDLNTFSYFGFDAACLGNHEMDKSPEGIALMIKNAKKDASGKMTPILCANIDFGNMPATGDTLRAIYGKEGEPGKYVFPYIIRTTPSGIKVGIFGLLGQEIMMPAAGSCTFAIKYPEIQNLVNELRDKEKVNVVICVSHASFDNAKNGGAQGELPKLAQAVSGIDLICAGHSHSTAEATVECKVPDSKWTTTIMEAGGETRNVAQATLQLEQGKVSQKTAKIIPLDGSIPGKPEMVTKVADFISDIEADYLKQFPTLKNGKLFDVLTKAPFKYNRQNGMYMVADAIRAAAGSDVALVTPGGDTAFAESDSAGNVTVYEAFHAMPHSMGRDGLQGGPLYKFMLVAAELQGMLEFATCNAGQASPDLFLVPSGVRLVYSTADLRAGNGPGYILKMSLVSPDEKTETLIFDRTDKENFPYNGWKSQPKTTGGPGDPYQPLTVCISSLSLSGMRAVNVLNPKIDLWPRDQTGAQVKWNDIAEVDPFMVRNNDKEVKAWYAVAQYLLSFGGQVPPCYDDVYTDGKSHNPIGPSWRRIWDIADHPIQ